MILEILTAQLKHNNTPQVQTKGVSQCVEFYYHSKRIREKQRKLKEKEAQKQQMAAETLTPTNQVQLYSFLYKMFIDSASTKSFNSNKSI